MTQQPGPPQPGMSAPGPWPPSPQPHAPDTYPHDGSGYGGHGGVAQSGPVSPWSHSGYLPPVDPVPAPVLPHGYPAGYGGRPPVPPQPRSGRWKPSRVDAVPGTGYAVVHLEIAPVTSGLAVGALLAGVAALIVGFIELCLGIAGARNGWGAWVAGAFTVLGLVTGGGGVGLGLAALRQIRRSGQPGLIRFTGRGPALAGVWCGGIGLGICLLSLAFVLAVQVL